MKSGNLNFLEPSESLQTYNGTALPLALTPFLLLLALDITVLIYISLIF